MRFEQVAEAYEKHADDLVRFAATQVGPSAAEDVVSDAVAGVLRSGAYIDNVRAFLYRAVANAAVNYWRSQSRRKRRELATYLENGEPDRDALPDVDVVAAVAALSVRQRAVVHLTYWEDLAPAQVADRLGISHGSVKRHLARAHSSLRNRIR